MVRHERKWRVGAEGLALTMIVSLVAGACSADSVIMVERSSGRIDRTELIGDYVGAAIIFVDGADTTDLTASGAFFNITLGDNSGLAGRAFIPGAGAGGADLDADMAGAWTFDLVGQVVRFVQQADTFVRDSEWPASRDGFAIELRGTSALAEAESDAPRFEVVLRKG